MSAASVLLRSFVTPRRALTGALLCLLALALVVRARDPRPVTLPPAEGGVLRSASVGRPTTVNPLTATTPAERDLAALVFAGLTRLGADGTPQPALAERWQVSADGRLFVFQLRNGLLWHDGAPVTVADVLFTLDVLAALGDRADPRLRTVWSRARVSRLGADELRVELAQPYAPLPAFATFGLLPAHRFGGVAPTEVAAHEFFARPVGAGPFRLDALDHAGARLRRFEGYALGAPYLDGVELMFVDSVDAARSALLTGAVDTAALPVGVSGDARLTARPLALSVYTMVLLNTRDPLLADERVRRALTLAVDRVRLADAHGGAPLAAPLARGWWTGDYPPPPPDLDAAAALLSEAGWRRDADGVFRREGRDLLLTLAVGEERSRQELARHLTEHWGRLGVRVVAQPRTSADLLTNVLAPRAFQAALIGWDPGPDPDPFSALHSSLAGDPAGNLSNAADPALDDLLARGRAAVTQVERQAVYGQVAARFLALAPAVVLFSEQQSAWTPATLGGVGARAVADPAGRWADAHRWFLHTRGG